MIVANVKARVTGGTDWIRTSGDDKTAIIVMTSSVSTFDEKSSRVSCLAQNWNSVTSTSSLMSEYSIRPGGSLKLKGGVAEGGIVKKLVINS